LVGKSDDSKEQKPKWYLLRAESKSALVDQVETSSRYRKDIAKMRIGCLQFAPQVGDVNNNMNRADAVLSKAAPEDLDLLVLPELAFSG
jgi:hypothetical protein